MPIFEKKDFVEEAVELFNLVIGRKKEDEKGVFLETLERILKIIGNILFLAMLSIVVFWLISKGFALLPSMIKNWLSEMSAIGLVVKIIFYGGSLYLTLMKLALQIRQLIHLYKLTEFYAYFELGRMLLTEDEKPFIGMMLEALKHTFLD